MEEWGKRLETSLKTGSESRELLAERQLETPTETETGLETASD